MLTKASRIYDRTYLPGLDLLRLFAALLILLDDLGAFSAAHPGVGPPFAFQPFNLASRFGWVGVEIFFVISGFGLAISANRRTASEFIKRRLIRIMPVLWACSLIAAAALWQTDAPLREILPSFVRSATLFPVGPYVDGTIWALIAGTSFYLLVWAILLLGQTHNLERIATILGLASALFLSIFVAEVAWHGLQSVGPLGLFERFVFKRTLLRYGVFFAFGILLWLGIERGLTPRRMLFCCIFAVYGGFEIALHAASEAAQVDFVIALPPIGAISLAVAVWVVAVCGLIASVHLHNAVGGKSERCGGVVRPLGRLAYALYLNHYTLGAVIVYRLLSRQVEPSLVFLTAATVILGSSWFITRWGERAIARVLGRLLGVRDSNPHQAVQV
jgi:peptidoglycan/LPS O-acetylase OafA/YrhL